MTLRAIDYLALDREVDITTSATPQSSVPIPAIASIKYWLISIEEDAPDNGGTVKNNARISQAISKITMTSAQGRVLWSMSGAQLERLANQLDTAGQDVDAPAPGDGTRVAWHRVLNLPVSRRHLVGQSGTDAKLDIEFAKLSSLYSANPTAGKTVVKVGIRPAYSYAGDVRTRYVNVARMDIEQSTNGVDIGRSLPEAELIHWVMLLKADDVADAKQLTDARLRSVEYEQDRSIWLADADVERVFKPQDIQARRSGHNDGEIRLRMEEFVKLPTSRLLVAATTALLFDLVTVTDGGAFRDKDRG